MVRAACCRTRAVLLSVSLTAIFGKGDLDAPTPRTAERAKLGHSLARLDRRRSEHAPCDARSVVHLAESCGPSSLNRVLTVENAPKVTETGAKTSAGWLIGI